MKRFLEWIKQRWKDFTPDVGEGQVVAAFYWLMLLVAILLMIAGCGGMSNDEIIRETKKCEAAGMKAQIQENLDGQAIRVVCVTKN